MMSRRSNGTTKPMPDASTSKRPTIVRGAALEDAHDPSFGAVAADPLDPRDDAVAVHRLVQVAAGDVKIAADLVDRPVGHDEPEAPGIG